MYAVIKVVERSDETNLKGWWRQNEVTVVITLIGTIYPIIFDVISYLEKYHPRKALRLQLARLRNITCIKNIYIIINIILYNNNIIYNLCLKLEWTEFLVGNVIFLV